SGNNFFGCQFAAIGTAITARPHLIARMNLLDGPGFGVVKFNGVWRVAANHGGVGAVNDDALTSHRDCDGFRRRVDSLGEPVYTALLPVLQIVLVLGFKVGM